MTQVARSAWQAPAFSASGLLGATAGARFVGATASGAPTTGAFLAGDWCVSLADSSIYICKTGGSPGGWNQAAGAGAWSTTITGDGATTSFVVTPTITPVTTGAWGVVVTEASTGNQVIPDVTVNQSTNAITIKFAIAPVAAKVYSVLVIGAATSSTKIFRTVHTFAIQGNVTVVTVPPFFFSLSSGQTTKIVKTRYVIQSGTNVTFKIQKNGADWTGYGTTASPLTATSTAAETVQSNALADNDLITLVLVGISGTPANLTVTCVLEHTV